MNTKVKKQKGITLIALIVTIIIMLILSVVTISIMKNSGLVGYARKAVRDTQKVIDKEQQIMDTMASIEGVDGELFSVIYTSTRDYTDINGDTAVIPKGFSVGISEGIKTIEDGLVIQDRDGNQFVWIPVEDANFYRSDWSEDVRTTLSANYVEPYSSGYKEESAEYNAMVKSVKDNGGFYIGRFEAGSITPRTDTSNQTTKMVVKRDAYPYIYVGWGLTMTDYTSDVTYVNKDQGLGALALSKSMYANKDVGVTSTLCYGIQWDTMLDFIKDDKHSVTASTTWGNYEDNPWTIDRKTAKYTSNPSSDTDWNLIDDEEGDSLTKNNTTSILLTTGASDRFAAKNIFDVAGNVYEWTNESFSISPSRVFRGGGYRSVGSWYYDPENPYYSSFWPAAYRGVAAANRPDYDIGFRPVLYIS